jgi:hypothetical protein
MLGPVRVRPLRQVEIEDCGNFSLIETFYDKVKRKETSAEDMLQFAKIQNKIMRYAMISPSYDEALEAASLYEDAEGMKAEIKKAREAALAENNADERKKKERTLLNKELAFYQIFPADFAGTIFSYGVELVDKNDIKKVDEEILKNLAIMAKNNNNRPSENITGNFTEFNKADIDRRAWAIYAEEQEKRNAQRNRRRNR